MHTNKKAIQLYFKSFSGTYQPNVCLKAMLMHAMKIYYYFSLSLTLRTFK